MHRGLGCVQHMGCEEKSSKDVHVHVHVRVHVHVHERAHVRVIVHGRGHVEVERTKRVPTCARPHVYTAYGNTATCVHGPVGLGPKRTRPPSV